MKTQRQRKALADRAFAFAKLVIADRDGGRCVACGAGGCEVHHRRNKGAGGASGDPGSSDLARLMLVCRPCHDWIGRYPSWAESVGWWIPHGLEVCAEVPLLYRGEWKLLTDDGQIVPVPMESRV